ncbi:hypothetical protein [Bernardetia sp. MNP-M8]|uniref:hypothetical protein n=1 Tax=Bernardetia sp. MNP-M8 TaxID=3127470 RepID=UPI0030CBE08D
MKHILSFNSKFLSICLLFFSFTLQAQDYTFKPAWKVGTEKKIIRTTIQKKYEADSLVESSELVETDFLKVIEETNENYMLEIFKENLAIIAAKEFDEKIEEKLPNYKHTRFRYELNKSTGEYKLLNWQEAKKSIDESFVELEKLFEGTDNEGMTSLISLIVTPNFMSEEVAIEYMKTQIDFLFIPFSEKSFSLNDTISITQSDTSPFNPMQKLSVKNFLALEKVENNTAIFKQKMEMDMSEMIDMVKSMMLSMTKSMDISEEAKAEKLKEIDEIEMTMNHEQFIIFDIKSSWVESSEMTMKVGGFDPQKGKRLDITSYKITVE